MKFLAALLAIALGVIPATGWADERPANGICFQLDAFENNLTEQLRGASAPESPIRRALVIGNSDYEHVPALKNPENDAEAVAQALRTTGFRVHLLLNATKTEVEACATIFKKQSLDADVALFYYAGHGIQVDNTNFIVSIDAGAQLDGNTGLVPVTDVIDELNTSAAATLIFLDACRTNPFGEDLPQGLNVSTARSAVPLEVKKPKTSEDQQATGVFVAYSTSPNAVALDGEGDLSPFTEAFTKRFVEPGMSIHQLMLDVGRQVGDSTDWQQTPWSRSSLTTALKLVGQRSLDEAQAESENWAGRSASLLSTGLRTEAIAAALKGLPPGWPEIGREHFQQAEAALEYAYRSGSSRIDLEGAIEGAGFSPDGKRIVTFGRDDFGQIGHLWSAETGEQLAELVRIPNEEYNAYILSWAGFAFSPDSLLTAMVDSRNSLQIFETTSGRVVSNISKVSDIDDLSFHNVTSMSFNTDGSELIVNTTWSDVTTRFDTRTGGRLESYPDEIVLSALYARCAVDPTLPRANVAKIEFINESNLLGIVANVDVDGSNSRTGVIVATMTAGYVVKGCAFIEGTVFDGTSARNFNDDGTRFFFPAYGDRASWILAALDTSKVVFRRLMENWAPAALSPDGSLIAFTDKKPIEFVSTSDGALAGNPLATNFLNFAPKRSIYDRNGGVLHVELVDDLDDVWKAIPHGQDLLTTSLHFLPAAHQKQVASDRIRYWAPQALPTR